MKKTILSPLFLTNEGEFLKLWQMWNAICIAKRNQIKFNVKIKVRDWKEKNQLEELKEDYLQAIILRRSCETLANICKMLWFQTLEKEEESGIDWKRIASELRSIH